MHAPDKAQQHAQIRPQLFAFDAPPRGRDKCAKAVQFFQLLITHLFFAAGRGEEERGDTPRTSIRDRRMLTSKARGGVHPVSLESRGKWLEGREKKKKRRREGLA